MNFTLSYSGNVLNLYPDPTISGYNKEYTITIPNGISGYLPNGSVGVLSAPYVFWFTTQYCPLFTTLNRVKLLLGPIADSIVDDTIYRMIHKNSLDAIDLYGLQNNVVVPYYYFGCTWENVPAALRRYVECKTAYDILALLLVNQSLGSGGGGGDQLKTLGDMTIKYGGAAASSASSGDPKQMKDLYQCWNEQFRMFRNMKVTVKALYDVSKGYSHPAVARTTNRVIRPVIPFQGNYTPGTHFIRGI